MSKVVLNSSVIIALSVLSHLNKLKHLFKETLIARAVYEEICIKGRGLIGAAELSEMVKKGVIKVKDVVNQTQINALIDPLARGEAETITITVEENAEYIVMDDRLARRRAKKLGLNGIGTLRILRTMLDNGLIDKKELLNAIEKLRETGFRISNEVIDKLLKELQTDDHPNVSAQRLRHHRRPLQHRPQHIHRTVHKHRRRHNHQKQRDREQYIMEGASIDCGRRITDSLIGRNVKIPGYEQNIPKGYRLILGDMATVTL